MDSMLPGRLNFGALKAGFASLISQAEPHSLPPFILWLDLKVGQFKVNGCMYPDTLHEETWVAYAREVLEKVNANMKQTNEPGPDRPVPRERPRPAEPPSVSRTENKTIDNKTNQNGPPQPKPVNTPLCLVKKRNAIEESAPSIPQQPSSQPEKVVNPAPVKKPSCGVSPIKKRPLPQELLYPDSTVRSPSYMDSLKTECVTPPPALLPIPPPNTSVGSVLGTLRSLLSEPAPPSGDPDCTLGPSVPVYPDTMPPQLIPATYSIENHENNTKEALKIALTKKRRQRQKRSNRSENSPLLPVLPQPQESADTPSTGMDTIYSSPVALSDPESSPCKLPPSTAWSPSKDENPPSSPKSCNICPICYRKFDYRSSFRRHMRIHEGVYSHQCAVCGRKFTRKEHFDRHKCSRRPNKPNRSADSSNSNTSKRIKVAYPPTTSSGDVATMQAGYNYTGGQELESTHPGGMLDDSMYFEKENTGGDMSGGGGVEVLAQAAALHLAAESRRKSSNPRKLVSQDEVVQEAEKFFTGSTVDLSESDYSHVSAHSSPRSPHSDGPNCLPPAGDVSFEDLSRLVQEADIPERLREYVEVSSQGSDDEGLSDEEAADGEFTLDSGTYKVSEEEYVSLEGEDTIETTTHGSFIKVTKQGKYLKLKNEVQAIDGRLCFVCPSCSKVFHRSSNFSRHMRIHRGVYSYICPTCQRGFFRKEHFQKHKCHRKSMSHIWERKTKLDMVLKSKNCSDDTLSPEETPSVSSVSMESPTMQSSTDEGEDRLYIDDKLSTVV